MYKTIARLWWKRLLRGPHRTGRIGARLLFMLFVGLPLVVSSGWLGYILEALLRQIEYGGTAADLVNGALLHIAMLVALVTPFVRRQPYLTLRPLLVLPVPFRSILHAVQWTTLFSWSTVWIVVFLIAFGVRTVHSLYWLAGTLVLLAVSQSLAAVLRHLWHVRTVQTLILYVAVGGGLLIDAFSSTNVVGTASFVLFDGLLHGHVVSGVVLVGAYALAYALTYRTLRRALRVDSPARTVWRQRGGSGVRPGRVQGRLPMVLLEGRLILRNSRVRFFVLNVVTFGVLGGVQFFAGWQNEDLLLYSLGSVLLVASPGLMYGFHTLRLKSVFFDGLMAWPLSPVRLVSGTVGIVHGATVCLFLLLGGLVAVVQPSDLLPLAGLFVYTLGIANYAFLFAGTYEKARYDISLGAFDFQGAMVSNPAASYACVAGVAAMPLLLLWTLGDPLHPGMYLPLYALGGAGLAAHRFWTRQIARHLRRRKYVMAAGFRQAD